MGGIWYYIRNFIIIKILLGERTLQIELTLKERNHIDYAKLKLKELLSINDCLQQIRISPNYEYMIHVIAHRDAFAKLEYHTKYHGLFSATHDLEKIGFGLVLGKDITKSIHKKVAAHHNIDWTNPDGNVMIEKIFDWESCHHTKLKAPETAYEYVLLTHPDKISLLEPVLKELGLWGKHNQAPLHEEQYEIIVNSIHDEHILAELRKSYAYICENF